MLCLLPRVPVTATEQQNPWAVLSHVVHLVHIGVAGFDVWMYNGRSNDFSRGNLHYSWREAEYWYTSVDEMALIDLPADISYILEKTGASKLQLLTHSQGGTWACGMHHPPGD